MVFVSGLHGRCSKMGDTHTQMTRMTIACILAGTLVIATVTAGGIGTAAAQETPETADEFFETFRAMEGTEAYQEYEEFETLRTFAITRVQEVGTLDEDDRAEFTAVLDTMVAFERAYELASADDYEKSLAAAKDAESAIDDLESYGETQATLANLAMTRFYVTLGDGLREEASSTERAPDRVELLSTTATAYERANRPTEAAEFNLQAEQLSAEYNAAVTRIDDAEATAGVFLEQCPDCSTVTGVIGGFANPVQIFAQYQASQESFSRLRAAQDDATDNGLSERASEIESLATDVDEARRSLAVASALILIGYGLAIGVLGAIVFARVFYWQRTYDRGQIGAVITQGDTDV